MKDFRDKVAVVTGAGSGIGRGLAYRCAQEGMKVVLADIDREAAMKTAAELATGTEALVVQTDVSKLDDVEALAQKTLDTFGEVHMLFNNAGVVLTPRGRPIWEDTIADWEWVVGVNMWGVFYGVRTFIPIMMRQQCECHVINVASVAALMIDRPHHGSYFASKQAVVGLTESLFFDLGVAAPQIKVSLYFPVNVSTNIFDSERNRPTAPQTDPAIDQLTPEEQAMKEEFRKGIGEGMPIEEAADIAFKGILGDKLYIGIEGFDQYEGHWRNLVQTRFDNILNERNPELPS